MIRPSTIIALLLSIVCAAVVILWMPSYRNCDVPVSTDHPRGRFTVTSEFGVLVFEVEWPQPAQIHPGWSYFTNPLPRHYAQPSAAVFALYTASSRHYLLLPPTPLLGFTVPHAFAFAMTALLPAITVARRSVARRHLRTGRCRACGYDLRATPMQCPECGLPVTKSL